MAVWECFQHFEISLSTTFFKPFSCFIVTFHSVQHHFLNLEMCTDHVSTATTLPITVYVMSILLFPFFLIFWLYFPILGNAQRPCEQYPNIVSNSWYNTFLSFLCVIFGYIVPVTIFGDAHRHLNGTLMLLTWSILYTFCFSVILWLYWPWVPYLKMRTDHVDITQSSTTHIFSFS